MIAVLLVLILDVKTKRLLLRRFESDKINQTFDLALRALSEFKQAKRQRLFESWMPTEIIFTLA